jgi:hypothetical protein
VLHTLCLLASVSCSVSLASVAVCKSCTVVYGASVEHTFSMTVEGILVRCLCHFDVDAHCMYCSTAASCERWLNTCVWAAAVVTI